VIIVEETINYLDKAFQKYILSGDFEVIVLVWVLFSICLWWVLAARHYRQGALSIRQ